MNRPVILWLMMALGVSALLVGPAEATVIYVDDFSGSGSAYLNGTAPDVRPGSETWTTSTTSPAWMADGSITGSGDRNGWLPFTPQPGNIYKLSLAMDVTANSNGNWFAVGFAQANSTTVNFAVGGDPNAAAWMLKRGPVAWTSGPAYEVYSFLGPGTISGQSAGGPYPGWTELAIQLDTRSSQWTAQWFMNGTPIRGPVTYGTNPTINYVGFGRYIDAAGVVDNFRLEIVPEPAAWVLLTAGLGGLGALSWWKRRKA